MPQVAGPSLLPGSLFSKKHDPWGFRANLSLPTQKLGSLGKQLIQGVHFFISFNLVIDKMWKVTFHLGSSPENPTLYQTEQTQRLCFKTYLNISENHKYWNFKYLSSYLTSPSSHQLWLESSFRSSAWKRLSPPCSHLVASTPQVMQTDRRLMPCEAVRGQAGQDRLYCPIGEGRCGAT